jgi:hypothetical protein
VATTDSATITIGKAASSVKTSDGEAPSSWKQVDVLPF